LGLICTVGSVGKDLEGLVGVHVHRGKVKGFGQGREKMKEKIVYIKFEESMSKKKRK